MRSILLALTSAVFFSLAPVALAQDALVLRGGTVLPMDGPAVADADLVIVAGKIAAVGPRGKVEVPKDARVVDVTGRFLMPGLIDAHAHAGLKDLFPELFLAHGVTTIRDMGNDLSIVRALAAEAKSGTPRGPDVVYVGPILDGDPPVWPTISQVVTDPAQVPAILARLKEGGVSAVKVYERLSPEVYDAIVGEAKKLGLPVVGHCPEKVGGAKCIDAGQHTIEHLSHLAPLVSKSGADAGLMGELTGWADMDGAKAKELIKKLVAKKVALDPTFVVLRNLAAGVAGDKVKGEGEQWVPRLLRETFWKTWERTAPADEATRATLAKALEARRRFVKRAHAAGVPILTGSDTPNPHVVPGPSLHEELDELAQVIGLEEALRSATLVNAQALGRPDLGRLSAGARADVLVLKSDPTKSIRATRELESIVARGTLLDGAAIRALLASVEKKVAELDAQPVSGFAAIEGPLSIGKLLGREHRLEGQLGTFPPSFWQRSAAFEENDGRTLRRSRAAFSMPLPGNLDESLVTDREGKLVFYSVVREVAATATGVRVAPKGKGLVVELKKGGDLTTTDVPEGEHVELQGGLFAYDAIVRLCLDEGATKTLKVRRIDLDKGEVHPAVEWKVTRAKNPIADDARSSATYFEVEGPGPGNVPSRVALWLDERGLLVGTVLTTPFGPVTLKPTPVEKDAPVKKDTPAKKKFY